MKKNHQRKRRDILKLAGLTATLGGLGTPIFPLISPMAHAADKGKILVVLELSGGNDGLNTSGLDP